jgi:YVTN family beta-propeller protein
MCIMLRLVGVLLAMAAHAAGQNPLMVLLKGGNALAFYTPDGKLNATVPVGQHPHEMVLSADRKYAYVSDNGTMRIEQAGEGGNTISIVDVVAHKRVGVIDLGKFHRPHGIDIDPPTGRLVVTTENPDQLVLVDGNSRGVIRTYDTKGKTPHMVTLGRGGTYAYVSNAGSGNVSAVNLKTGKVTLINTGRRPEGSVLSPDGRELYVCNRDDNTITVIDTNRNAPIVTMDTCQGPVRIGITPDGERLVYACMKEKRLGIAEAKTRKQIGYALLTENPVSLHLSRNGKLAFASAEEQDTVYVVSTVDRRIRQEFKTAPGSAPDPVMEK